jgi:hypothetical protein
MAYTVSHQVWINSGSSSIIDRTVSSLSCPYVIPKCPYFYNKLPDYGPLRLETRRRCCVTLNYSRCAFGWFYILITVSQCTVWTTWKKCYRFTITVRVVARFAHRGEGGGSLSLCHGTSSGCGWRGRPARVAAIIVHKQSMTADTVWSYRLEIRRGAINSSPQLMKVSGNVRANSHTACRAHAVLLMV